MSTLEIFFLLLAAGIAIRISFRFDLNEWFKLRIKTQETKLNNMCPHARIEEIDDKKYHITQLLISPPGTLQWRCQQCGRVFDHNIISADMAYWQKDPMDLINKLKAYHKQAKKMGITP